MPNETEVSSLHDKDFKSHSHKDLQNLGEEWKYTVKTEN